MHKLKFLILSLISTFTILMIPSSVLAVNVLNPACQNTSTGQVPPECQDQITGKQNPLFGPNGLITKAVQIITIVVGLAAVVTIVISGLRLVMSNGDPNTASSARTAIIYAAIGIVIALVSQAMVTFVLSKVNVS